ncbi:unnamed protein product, partial [Ectocarpus sp. 12 AP-2014]
PYHGPSWPSCSTLPTQRTEPPELSISTLPAFGWGYSHPKIVSPPCVRHYARQTSSDTAAVRLPGINNGPTHQQKGEMTAWKGEDPNCLSWICRSNPAAKANENSWFGWFG